MPTTVSTNPTGTMSPIGLGIVGVATVATIGWWIAVVVKNFTPVSILGIPFIVMMLYYVYEMFSKKDGGHFFFFIGFVIFINTYCILDWFMPNFIEWSTLIAIDLWLLVSLFLILSGKMGVQK